MNYTIGELFIGQKASFSKTVTETDAAMFAAASGDFNPAHFNEEYAKTTIFGTRIAHGMIAAGFISTVLGNLLPGPGTVWISQTLNFLAPVRFGDTVTATVEIAEIMEKKVKVRALCTNQDGVKVLEGEGVVSPPRVKLE